MSRKVSVGRKLSSDMHRKLSQISNCSDISNISFKLGLDPDDFKSTIQNILDLDVGDDQWICDSDDESNSMNYYGDEESEASTEIITVNVDRKYSTVSKASEDSLDLAEDFEPVEIDVGSLKTVLNKYNRHKKISMSKIQKEQPESK